MGALFQASGGTGWHRIARDWAGAVFVDGQFTLRGCMSCRGATELSLSQANIIVTCTMHGQAGSRSYCVYLLQLYASYTCAANGRGPKGIVCRPVTNFQPPQQPPLTPETPWEHAAQPNHAHHALVMPLKEPWGAL